MKIYLLTADDQGIMILIWIGAAILSLWIFSEIIRAATKTNKVIELKYIEIKLLAAIAAKLGVDPATIAKDTKGISIAAIESHATVSPEP